MFDPEKRSHIEKAKKGLYSRSDEGDDYTLRKPIRIEEKDFPESWQESAPRMPFMADPEKKMSISKMLLMVSSVFFVVAAGAALYAFFGGSQLVSVDNIDVLVEGPASISGGETVSLDVSVVNKNNTDIELVDLTIEYPAGTKSPVDVSDDLTRERLSLGTIRSSGVAQREIRAVMFGVENEKKEIKFTVEYRTKDSNAIFYKEKTYELAITSSPVLVGIKSFERINSGQEADIEVTVSSNSPAPVENLLLVLDYPFGFAFKESSPSPVFSNNVFSVGDLSPGAKRTFIVRGSIEGEDGEDRALRANVGIRSQANTREIATTIISAEHIFSIEKPFVGLELALNGSLSGDLASGAGSQIRGDIRWESNLPVRIANGVIEVRFSGNSLDKNSVTPGKGRYNSTSNTIVWDSRSEPSLALISPGDDGKISFSFASLRLPPGVTPANPEISLSVSFKGSRVDETNSVEMLSGTVSRSVKISSNLAFASKSLHSTGSIENSGPIPPRADEKTTYTIVWTISSAASSMSSGEVRATLPPYVEWMDVTTPNADIRFNPTGGEVVWNVGDIPGGGAAKEVAFQVAITPSITQIGRVLQLVGEAEVTAIDDFSGSPIESEGRAVTTTTADPGMSKDAGTVQAN